MTMQLNGIPAKYSGKCQLCGRGYSVGDLIEKIPNSDGKRGHAQCVASAAGAHDRGRAYGARDAQPEPRETQSHRTIRNDAALPREFFGDVCDALTLIADGITKLARAFGRLAAPDPSDDPEIPF